MSTVNAPLITVFGSSRTVPEDRLYKEGVNLGKELAKHGFRVCTGGYGGLMEAVSRGASEAGSSPIGITFTAFGDECNAFVREQRRASDLFTRLGYLIRDSDGYIVMRGGMGTIAELMLAWVYVESGLRAQVPIVLLGECWRELITALQEHFTFTDKDFSFVEHAATPEEAVWRLKTLFHISQLTTENEYTDAS
ncbi:MAG TPA: LOG family protein [Pyrinomonadaceae bacterium]|nr:LOG family protein [Pyrinomonadaceae bacterium]